MAAPHYVVFPESHREAPLGATHSAHAPDDERVEVSIYLKPRPLPDHVTKNPDPRSALAAARKQLHDDDFAKLRKFAVDHGLEVVEANPARRLIRLAGTATAMCDAFKVTLHHHKQDQSTYRYYAGALKLREDIAPIVESVLGLDNRPVARHKIVIRRAASTAPSYLPNQIGALYGIPASPTGAGECIAIIELGGGYQDSDTQAAFNAMELQPPRVVAVSVDGASNQPTPGDNANAEVALDIQVAGAIAPGARLVVYFTSNSDAGFADAITAATADAANKPSVMSISWGGPESSWSTQALNTMNSALQDAGTAGISVTVAAGDNFATDGLTDGQAHVDFPASSPYALGCGGTSITVSNNQIVAEKVWNGSGGTGGGISSIFPVPSFQSGVNLPASVNGTGPGRGVPDVAGDGDPASGYQIVVGGQTAVVGGTSAVAPLWAGLIAIANEAAGAKHGFINPLLYANPSGFREITIGNNIPPGSTIGYQAGPGWNACTGLGVPVGQKLLSILTKTAVSAVS